MVRMHAEAVDQGFDLLLAHPLRCAALPHSGENGKSRGSGLALGLDLSGPRTDQRGVCARFQRGTMPGEFPVGFGDLSAQHVVPGVWVGMGVVECGQGCGEVICCEGGGQPAVQAGEDVVRPAVDGRWVGQSLCPGVFGRVAAAVVRASVVPVALQTSPAIAADNDRDINRRTHENAG
jgi:hypothetical protein